MSAAAYWDAELAVLQDQAARRSRAKAEELAAKRAKEKRDAEERVRRTERRKHTVEVDTDCGYHSVCLLDVDADHLRKALETFDETKWMEPGVELMQRTRALYLAGNKEGAIEAIYPAIRDALGVAI